MDKFDFLIFITQRYKEKLEHTRKTKRFSVIRSF